VPSAELASSAAAQHAVAANIPENPCRKLAIAVAYYRDQFGFNIDWAEEENGFACVSRGDTRIFMTTPAFRSHDDFGAPIVLWRNLTSRSEIDDLHDAWARAGAIIADPPEAKPYKLYELFARDVDEEAP
jgi:hypothetical protein